MAKQIGLLKIEGTLDGLSFYSSKNGLIVRKKAGVSSERIKNDPRFVRTRENMEEFKSAAKIGKMLRDALRPVISNVADKKVTNRLSSALLKISRYDTTSIRGQRSALKGMSAAEGKILLKSFCFNEAKPLGKVLAKPLAVNTTTGVVSLANFIPAEDLIFPVEATHASISSCIVFVNASTNTCEIRTSNVVSTASTTAVVPLTLTPTALPTGTFIKIYMVKVEFGQLVNGVVYPFKNYETNTIGVLDVV